MVYLLLQIGETALFWAVGSTSTYRMEMLNLLLDHPAIDVNIQDNVSNLCLCNLSVKYVVNLTHLTGTDAIFLFCIWYRKETRL